MNSGPTNRPHNTAIARTAPSTPARLIARVVIPRSKPRRILDFACGRGVDIPLYAEHAEARGFDLWPEFGFSDPPEGLFDLVTVVYLLNVLDCAEARVEALRAAAAFLAPAGTMIVVTRSPAAILQEAESKGWPVHADGFWSSRPRGMFQRGISTDEIKLLATSAGLEPSSAMPALSLGAASSVVCLRRR